MKKFGLSALSIGCLALMGCSLFNNTDAEQKKREGEMFQEAIQSLDINKCENLDVKYEETCVKAIEDKIEENNIDEYAEQEIEKQATEEGNPEQCDKLVSENIRMSCMKNATLTKAIKEKDSNYCKNLQEEFMAECEQAVKDVVTN